MQQGLHDIVHHPVLGIIQQVPVQFPLLAPLLLLGEVLTHEEELLPGVPHHEGVCADEVPVLVDAEARHLVEHGALEVDDFVVGQHEDVLLRLVVAHGEGQLVVVVLAEVGIQLHVVEEVVHPAHVPLVRKGKAVVLDVPRDPGPGRRLLGDHHEALVAAPHEGVDMLEELDGLEVLVSALFIGHPLTGFLSVIQVEHGRNGVHPQAVDVVGLLPVDGAADQEILDLILPVIKDLRSPVGMLPLAGIGILVQGLTVELGQSVRILREVGGHPVEDDPDPVLVQVVDQVHEVLGAAVAGSRGVVARHLIAPGPVEGVLGNPHELDVGVAHVLHVFRQGPGQIAIGVKAVVIAARMPHPGTRMAFVDGHGAFVVGIVCRSPFHPVVVRPLEALDGRDAGCRSRTQLGRRRVRVGLVEFPSVAGIYEELVQLALGRLRYEELENAHILRRQADHVMTGLVPAVKLADHGDGSRMGRPHVKPDPLASGLVRPGMSPQLAEDVVVGPLAEEIHIQPGKISHAPPPVF